MAKDIDFSKTVVFTDIHYGLRNNSRDHNNSCEHFIAWMIEQAEEWGSKNCIFGGDWHHNRAAINVSTLNYSVSGLKMLNDYFDHVFFLIGNHDLFYRDKYEIHSIPYIREFPNLHAMETLTEIDGVCFVPWLVGDDWKRVPQVKSPYMFGHFELPKFKMNAMVEMPDHGLLNETHFANQQQVFTGHFHKRQNRGKVWYTGNCFPHDYSDAWDDDRGIMLWQPGQDPVFKSWPGAPRYRTANLSSVLEDPQALLDSQTHARLTIDMDITYEEANFLKELFERELRTRELHLQIAKTDPMAAVLEEGLNFESVDTIVISHLQNIESNTIDRQRLVEIYQSI
jgi:hypothetical protein